MLVRFPTAAPTADEIEIRTYVEGANKSNEPAKSLRDLSGYSVDAWPEAGQLRATIENPLHGVGYGLLWKLPVTDPGLPDDQGRGEIGDAIDDAETLRTRLLEIRKSEERWTELLNTIVDPFRNSLFDLLRRSSVDFDAAQVELVISLPSLPHLAILDYKGRLERQENMGLPTLRAFWANFDDSDPRFGLELPVPRSVSGRAYASNQIAEHLSPQLARAKAKHGEGLEPYWTPADPAGKPMQRHSILYAVPIRHWSVETVVMGSLSVGSFDLGSSLDLLRNDPAQTEKTLAAESAMYLVQLLGRNLWEFTNSRMP
jgi:hypothetical protein